MADDVLGNSLNASDAVLAGSAGRPGPTIYNRNPAAELLQIVKSVDVDAISDCGPQRLRRPAPAPGYVERTVGGRRFSADISENSKKQRAFLLLFGHHNY